MARQVSGRLTASAQVERPPQFVMIAFDNCTELDRWRDWSGFYSQIGRKARFTFFVSGTNFLAEANRRKYRGPRHAPGQAVIDFGGTVQDVKNRIDLINALYDGGRRGHEFASHAVGHFHAGEERWTAADWSREFQTYHDLLDNVAGNNGLSKGFDFASTDVRGFRAPFLEAGAGLDAALKRYRYSYDTSLDGAADGWPKRDANGVWRFNLASIRVPGYPRPTLSMDYNFFVLQSKGVDDPDHSHWPRYGKEMFDAYMAYFRANYRGNRAPLHIGHHFAEYQGGTYKRALMAFIREICALPEVRCVTYSELAEFLEPLSAETLRAYQRGDFPRGPLLARKAAKPFAGLGPIVSVEAVKRPSSFTIKASLPGADRTRFKGGRFEWRHEGRRVGTGPTFDASQLARGTETPLTIAFREAGGKVRWQDTIPVEVGPRGVKLQPGVACCHGMKLRRRGGGAI